MAMRPYVRQAPQRPHEGDRSPYETATDEGQTRHGRRGPAEAPYAPATPAFGNPPASQPIPSHPGATGDAAILELHAHLESIQDLLRKILDVLSAQVPLGIVSLNTQVVGSATNPVFVTFDGPTYYLLLLNDGPGNVQYRIPATLGSWIDLLTTDQPPVYNLPTGAFSRVALRLAANQAASSVRLISVR